MIIGFGAVLAVWVLTVLGYLYSWANTDLDVAVTPVPSPHEIAYQLQAEWGREPTVVEVAAVHQMLTSRRTEAALVTAAKDGFIYELSKTAKGRKP